MRWIVRSGRVIVAALVFSVFVTGAAHAQGVTTGAVAGIAIDSASRAPAPMAASRSRGCASAARIG